MIVSVSFFTLKAIDDVLNFFFSLITKKEQEERKNKKKSDVPSRIFVVNNFSSSFVTTT